MKRLLRYFVIFFLPILIIGTMVEIMLRRIPNDYQLKKEFLDQHADSLEVLFLGNSHAFYGVNPKYISSPSFNAGDISQSLDYDLEILKKYKNHWNNLEYIAIPISYFSLYSALEDDVEAWRIKNYLLYFGIRKSHKLADHTEILSNRLGLNLKRIYNAYVRNMTYITCSALGWGLGYTSKKKNDLDKSGIIAAEKHTDMIKKPIDENLKIVRQISAFADARGVEVIFYTPPAWHTYTENLDDITLFKTVSTMTRIDKQYQNVHYYNLLTDHHFQKTDFFDADHLNEIGAKKLTFMLDSLIKSRE